MKKNQVGKENGKPKVVLAVIVAVIVFAFAIPSSRRLIIDSFRKMNEPLPPGFWDYSDYRGEHIDEDEKPDDRR